MISTSVSSVRPETVCNLQCVSRGVNYNITASGKLGRNSAKCFSRQLKNPKETQVGSGVTRAKKSLYDEYKDDPKKLTEVVIEEEARYIAHTYVRPPIVFTHGEGSYMFDSHGKKYLDFAAGIAVNSLGSTPREITKALKNQSAKLIHTSNLFHTIPQVDLARRLVKSSFADRVFFSNSGTEANEAAIKFSRLYARVQAGVDPYDTSANESSNDSATEILSFTNAFHGRTLGALSLTYKVNYKTPFKPLLPDTKIIPFLDESAAKEAIKKGRTAAVFVEPLQGEGGVIAGTRQFLSLLRKLCDKAGCLLVFDEVQCGLARTGKLWAHSHFGIEPDMMTLAKPLADHGSTFAGSPLVMAAACSVFDTLSRPKFIKEVNSKGQYLRDELEKKLSGNKNVLEVRGMGLICGIQLNQAADGLCKKALEAGLIVITAGKGDVVRLLPPLNVSVDQIDECINILVPLLEQL